MLSYSTYTRTVLINAFEMLLDEKPLEDITVSDICKKAGASRSTFYKYFSDKYEIMIWKYKEALNSIHSSEKGVEDWREGTLAGIKYFADNRDYFLKIIDYKGQNSVEDFFYRFALDFTKKIMCKKNNTDWIPEIEYQAARVYIMGTNRYIIEWIKSMHMPPEKLADLMCNCMPPVLSKYFH